MIEIFFAIPYVFIVTMYYYFSFTVIGGAR